jgi:hypothetical protein
VEGKEEGEREGGGGGDDDDDGGFLRVWYCIPEIFTV